MTASNPNLQNMKPTLRRDLRVTVSMQNGELIHVIEDPINGKLYELGQQEAKLLLGLDGNRNLQEICVATQELAAADIWDEARIEKLCTWAISKNLFLDHSDEAIGRQKGVFKRQRMAKWFKWTNPISINFSFGSPERLLRRISPWLQDIFGYWSLLLFIVVGVFALSCLYMNFDRFAEQASHALANGGWVTMIIVWLAIKIAHELAHGVASHKYGAHVKDCGTVLILFMPMAFMDISSSAKLPNRWHRIIISAAGMYVELFLTALAIIVWTYSENQTLSNWLHALIFTAGLSTILFNANPLMRFDGYYIASDLLGITNLSGRAKTWLDENWKYYCLGVAKEPDSSSGWRWYLLASYAFAAWFWKMSLQITLTIAAAALFHGFGILIAVVSVVFFIGMPTYRIATSVFLNGSWRAWHWRNVSATAVTATLSLWLATSVLTGPVLIDSPGVIRFQNEKLVRAGCDGFLEKVLVANGQAVKKDQVLAILGNREIDSQILTLEIAIAQSDERGRQARQKGEWNEYAAENQQKESLLIQLHERQSEHQMLHLRAPCDGIAMHRDLEERVGQYLHKGNQILTINDAKKEVAISISQDDYPSLSTQTDQAVKLIFPSEPSFQVMLTSVSPNASQSLPSISMASNHGGPLLVEPVSKSDKNDHQFFSGSQAMDAELQELKLLSPRFTATAPLPTELADRLPLGQTGTVFFRSQRQSLASYCYISFRRWLQKQLRTV